MVRICAFKLFTTGLVSAVFLQSVQLLPVGRSLFSQSLATLDLMPPALASDGIRYRPPRLKRAIRTAGTGSRILSCDRTSRISLTPLVPDTHIGLTTVGRPTFLASVSGIKSAEFSLVEPGIAKPLVVQTVQPDAQGLVRVEMPKTAPELVAGKEYRWSLSVVCNPNRRSQDIYAQSLIQRVQLTSETKRQLSAADSEQAKGRIYASAGLWYDAVAALSKGSSPRSVDSVVTQDLTALLNQVGLNLSSTQGQGAQANSPRNTP